MSFVFHSIFTHRITMVFLWLLMIFFTERLSKKFALPRPINDHGVTRWLRNLVLGLINKLLLPALTFPILLFAVRHQFFHRPDMVSGGAALIMDVIILDFVSYGFHVMSHKNSLLWRFHEVHHTDTAFDVTTGLRIHFGELLIANIFRAIPILIFAIPLKSVIIFELILTVEGLFHHTNIAIPERINKIFGFVITMPDRHVVHHHSYQPDTDSNYGFIFVWWDKIFGSFNSATRTSDWKIGLEYKRDQSLIDLLLSPFRIKNLLKSFSIKTNKYLNQSYATSVKEHTYHA